MDYGSFSALRGVDLEIPRGDLVALVGPSGSGKTSLLRSMNGMVQPSAGEVEVLGKDLLGLAGEKLRNLRSRIGVIPQDLGLVPNLRVHQNVLAGKLGRQGLWGSLKSMLFASAEEKERCFEVLERVGVAEKIFTRTDQLSGGQQQRVAVARALYQGAEVLLADEPVSSVDPARAQDTVRLLTELARAEGVSLVMSLHNLDLAREYFPRLVGLRGGNIAFDSEADALGDEAFDQLYSLSEEEILEN